MVKGLAQTLDLLIYISKPEPMSHYFLIYHSGFSFKSIIPYQALVLEFSS